MPTLERAIEIAARAHAGQRDKAGRPYILHPLRVMLAVRSEHEQLAAVLHDVLEDTRVTLDDLQREGFPLEVLEAVLALTRAKDETRIDAAVRAAANPIARNVKLADVNDNVEVRRIANPTKRDLERLEEYKQVKALLIASGAC